MPGILTMDVHAADTSRILTGGNDRCATVFNKETEQVVAILKGHTKKVTKALYHPEKVILKPMEGVMTTITILCISGSGYYSLA